MEGRLLEGWPTEGGRGGEGRREGRLWEGLLGCERREGEKRRKEKMESIGFFFLEGVWGFPMEWESNSLPLGKE